MTCSEAELYVSALNDGEPIPKTAGEHIMGCQACRRILRDYARIGAELRLAAITELPQLPALQLSRRRSGLMFLWRPVAIPRFAFAAMIACVVASALVTSMMRAQSKSMWFQFGYSLEQGDPSHYFVAKEGFEDTMASMEFVHGELVTATLRLKVDRISHGDVVLRMKAVPAPIETTPTGGNLLHAPLRVVSLDGVPSVHYRPGESLPVPIEGGGMLYLKGDVLDHQPSIAFGTPLVPAAEKMNVRWPVLLESGKLIGELRGASTTADKSSEALQFTVPEGVFTFALRPFPGATQGEANWGEISCKLDGKAYLLLAAAPITGGDQPRPVWVRHDPQPEPLNCPTVCLGPEPLPK